MTSLAFVFVSVEPLVQREREIYIRKYGMQRVEPGDPLINLI